MNKGAWVMVALAVGVIGFASPAAARRLDTVQKERVREEREQRRAQKAALQDEERERHDKVAERAKRGAHHRDMEHDDFDIDALD